MIGHSAAEKIWNIAVPISPEYGTAHLRWTFSSWECDTICLDEGGVNPKFIKQSTYGPTLVVVNDTACFFDDFEYSVNSCINSAPNSGQIAPNPTASPTTSPINAHIMPVTSSASSGSNPSHSNSAPVSPQKIIIPIIPPPVSYTLPGTIDLTPDETEPSCCDRYKGLFKFCQRCGKEL